MSKDRGPTLCIKVSSYAAAMQKYLVKTSTRNERKDETCSHGAVKVIGGGESGNSGGVMMVRGEVVVVWVSL